MARIAKGVIEFEYIIEDYEENVQGVSEMSDKELLDYFKENMVDDIIDMRYSDISPCIEMEIVNETR